MTVRDPDDTIRAWLADGPSKGPSDGLAKTLAKAASTRQRRRRELAVPVWLPAAAMVALIAAAAIGLGAGIRIVGPVAPSSSTPPASSGCAIEVPVRGPNALLIGTGFAPDSNVVLDIDRADGSHITIDSLGDGLGHDSSLHTDRQGHFGIALRPYPEDLGRDTFVATAAGCSARLDLVTGQEDLPPACPDPGVASPASVDGPSYRATVTGDRPAHWWHLDDANERANDSSGSSSGTYLGTVVHARRTALSDGGAAFFNGRPTGPFTGIELSKPIVLRGDFTFEAWTYMCHYIDDGDVIAGSLDSPISIGFSSGGNLELWNGVSAVVSSSTPVATGFWQAWVITRSAGQLRLYLNGRLDAEGSAMWTGDVPISTLAVAAGRNLLGFLDEVSTYDHALVAPRIELHARP